MSKKAAKRKSPAKPAAKKKKAGKAVAKVAEAMAVPAPVVKVEPSPQARVMARHEYSSQERRGKGFSAGELSAVGLTFAVARSLRVPTDTRRGSVLEGNVTALKAWYKVEPKKPAAPKTEKKSPAEKPAKKPAKKAKKE